MGEDVGEEDHRSMLDNLAKLSNLMFLDLREIQPLSGAFWEQLAAMTRLEVLCIHFEHMWPDETPAVESFSKASIWLSFPTATGKKHSLICKKWISHLDWDDSPSVLILSFQLCRPFHFLDAMSDKASEIL